MKKKTVINEIFMIRALACLSVVLVHSITVTVMKFDLSQPTVDTFRSIQMMLMFATPTFILISELLVAYSYPTGTPKGFFTKRFLYIFVPYVMIGTVYTLYSFLNVPLTISAFTEKWVSIVVKGQWHGYFILIIFQFYLLHMLFAKYLYKFSPKVVLPIALFINGAYLGYFNFVPPTGPNGAYIWYDFSRLPFLGWIFYFALAYYCGKNLDGFRLFLRKFKFPILLATIVLAGGVVVSYHTGFIGMVWSNRLDVMFYTVMMMFSLYYLASKLPVTPKVILLISQYSFGIYLLHSLFHKLLMRYSAGYTINMIVFLLLAFLGGVIGSMLVTYLLNKLPLGKFMIGKAGKAPKQTVALDEKKAASY